MFRESTSPITSAIVFLQGIAFILKKKMNKNVIHQRRLVRFGSNYVLGTQDLRHSFFPYGPPGRWIIYISALLDDLKFRYFFLIFYWVTSTRNIHVPPCLVARRAKSPSGKAYAAPLDAKKPSKLDLHSKEKGFCLNITSACQNLIWITSVI